MNKILSITFLLILCINGLVGEVHYGESKSKLPDDPIELYINLMKRCVANTIYQDAGFTRDSYDPSLRETGRDWPQEAHTMIGVKRLDNVHCCLKEVILNNIPGDCIETGVWRGGATILMRAILKAYNDTSRKVWVADSFAGLPPPNPEKYPADEGLNLNEYVELAVSLDQVKENFSRYGLLDDQVIFIEGLFSNTLPTAPIDNLALLRLDGDLYESTMDALVNLYPKLSIGGFVIIDDYGVFTACSRAVEDYRSLHGITDPIIDIDSSGVYWKKTGN